MSSEHLRRARGEHSGYRWAKKRKRGKRHQIFKEERAAGSFRREPPSMAVLMGYRYNRGPRVVIHYGDRWWKRGARGSGDRPPCTRIGTDERFGASQVFRSFNEGRRFRVRERI